MKTNVMRKIVRIYTPQHISQQEGGKQGHSKVPCHLAAEEGLPSHHSIAPYHTLIRIFISDNKRASSKTM